MAKTHRFRKWLNVNMLRRLSLLGFTGFIVLTMVRHIATGEGGSAASPEAYCPFGGLETLFRYVSSRGAFVPHVHLSNVVLLVGVLGTAVLARSGFCGWVCPFGFIQELVSDLSRLLQGRVPVMKALLKGISRCKAFLAKADRYLRILKYLVLVWAVGGAAVFGVMVFRGYDPWATLINISELSLGPGLAVLLVVIIAALFVDRPWCRYACPLGAISGLLAKLSPVYLKREASLCKGCAVCTKACPMGIPVHMAETVRNADCISCLQCTTACPYPGSLKLKVGLPMIGTRGSEDK